MIRFIADIGSNHNQDLDRIKKLIEKAKEIGCYGVKFQLFNPEKLYAPGHGPGIEILKERALSPEWIENIYNICKDVDIKFGCTPFDIESIDVLKNRVDFFKISAWDAKRINFIKRCADILNCPAIISTGLLYWEETLELLSILKKRLGNITLLHSFSDYPTSFNFCKLHRMRLLGVNYNSDIVNIGWSDHTVEPGVLYAAWQQGAQVIEFHLDLEDMTGNESEHGHCWHPDKIRAVIDDINRIAKYAIYSQDDQDVRDNIIDQHRKMMADSDDGMRPLKEFRDVEK